MLSFFPSGTCSDLGGGLLFAHLRAAAAGAGERRCDWNPSRRTGGGRVRSRVVDLTCSDWENKIFGTPVAVQVEVEYGLVSLNNI